MRNLIAIFIVLLNFFGKFTHERICQFRVLNSPLHIIILTTGAMGSNSVDHTLGSNDSVAEASILMVRTTDSLVTSNRRDGPRKDSAVKEVSLIPSFQPEQSIIFNNKKIPANHDTSIHESQPPMKNKSAAAPSPAPRKILNGQPFALKDAPVSGTPTADSVPDTPTNAPVPSTPTAAPVPGTPTAASVPGTPTAAPVPGTPTAAPVPGTPTAAPVPGTPSAHDSQSLTTDISNQNGGGSDTVVDKAASHDFVSTNSKSAVAFLVIFVLMITCYLRRCKSSSSPAENYIRVPQGDTGEVRQSCTISWKR